MESYIQTCVYVDDQDMVRKVFTGDTLIRELKDRGIYYLNYRTVCMGEIRYFQMKAVPIGEAVSSRGVVIGFRCVDEETRAEMEKKNLLEDALAQANRASKAKSVFLSNMSHDIRTPMNAIIGFTALASTHIDNREQVEEYLKKIMTSGNHLLSLINDVLDMSRIESGKIYLDEKPCSLPDILHGLRSIVQADVHSKQLELYMDAVDVIHEDILCDRLRLKPDSPESPGKLHQIHPRRRHRQHPGNGKALRPGGPRRLRVLRPGHWHRHERRVCRPYL